MLWKYAPVRSLIFPESSRRTFQNPVLKLSIFNDHSTAVDIDHSSIAPVSAERFEVSTFLFSYMRCFVVLLSNSQLIMQAAAPILLRTEFGAQH